VSREAGFFRFVFQGNPNWPLRPRGHASALHKVFSSQSHSVSHPLVSGETKLHQVEKFEREEIVSRRNIKAQRRNKEKARRCRAF
jgi:hypothetical protein